jgi:prepilin-type N-terminal cleavage/methylation domain-containing protein/prepilin-type processing-associated H-X9-DG protein
MHRQARRGYTITELLVAIAIIVILAAMLIGVTRIGLRKAKIAPCVSNMKQIGGALQSYAMDHNMQLPGPLYVGQTPLYTAYRKHLGTHLAEYLHGDGESLEKDERINCFGCPAWWDAVSEANPDPPVAYWLGGKLRLTDGSVVFPWTYQADGGPMPENKPARITDFDLRSAGNTWAMLEMDESLGGTWTNRGPRKPVHGDQRTALFYDWHVGLVGLDVKP